MSDPPERLIRFMGPESGLRLLESGKINLTPPLSFNDPFEFCAAVPLRLSEETVKNCYLLSGGLLRQAHQSKRGYSDATYKKWVQDVVLNNPQLWDEGFRVANESFQRAASQLYGVVCFMDIDFKRMKEPDSVHFWDRYAGAHSGVAVEFDPRVGILGKMTEASALFPVSYVTPGFRPEFNLNLKGDDKVILSELRRLASNKSDVWESEQEWRLLMPLKSGALNGKISTSLVADQLRYSLELWSSTSATIPVKRVYLGARAPQELETSIRRLLHDRHDVQILRTKPSLTNFDLSYG